MIFYLCNLPQEATSFQDYDFVFIYQTNLDYYIFRNKKNVTCRDKKN